MKKLILTIALFSAFIISCNDIKNQNSETVKTAEDGHKHEMEEMAAETHSMDNAWVKDIKLDGDSKWQANTETTEGVDKMLNLVKSNDPKSVEDYHNLASKLNDEKNVLVKKCTMKGPSHDNLHVFLHPLIEKIEALGKVSTPDEGSEIKASIKENLEGYYNYFQ